MKNFNLLIIFFTSYLFAQVPTIKWQRTLGGNQQEFLGSVCVADDGGFLICGGSRSAISGDKTIALIGTGDFWIIKTNALGTIQWQKDYGGFLGQGINSAIQTADGGYLLTGTSTSNQSGDKSENCYGGIDTWVVKINNQGTIEWDKTLGGSQDETNPHSIQTPDGSYLIGMTSKSGMSGIKTENNIGLLGYDEDYWIIKLSATGSIEWQNTIGGLNSDNLKDIINTDDGGFLLGGKSFSSIGGDKTEASRGDFDYWIVKLDSQGTIIWDKTFGSSDGDDFICLSTTNEGGYMIAGSSAGPVSGDKTLGSLGTLGGFDIWILKLDISGNIIWQKVIGGDNSDAISSIVKDINGNFILNNTSLSGISFDKTDISRGASDIWIVKINSNGTILWDKTIGGSQYDSAHSITYVVSDNSIIVCGPSNSSISGDKTEQNRGPLDTYDFWVIKLNSENLSTNQNNILTSTSLFPNPTKDILNINLTQNDIPVSKVLISNLLGQIVYDDYVSSSFGQTNIKLDTSKLESGIYNLTLKTDKGDWNGKFVKD